jgi:hypothetical protein
MAALHSRAASAQNGRAERLQNAQAGNAVLAAQAKTAEDGAQRVQARLQMVPELLDRFPTEKFWNHVIQKIDE